MVKRGWWPRIKRGATILEASKTVLRKSEIPNEHALTALLVAL